MKCRLELFARSRVKCDQRLRPCARCARCGGRGGRGARLLAVHDVLRHADRHVAAVEGDELRLEQDVSVDLKPGRGCLQSAEAS